MDHLFIPSHFKFGLFPLTLMMCVVVVKRRNTDLERGKPWQSRVLVKVA